MREHHVWKWIQDHPSIFVTFERVETTFPPGTSDCFFTFVTEGKDSWNITGWLELKYCEPDDPSYLAGRIPKLRPAQPIFLTRQRNKRVPCGIVLRVGKDRWHFWEPTGNPQWNHDIRSTRAISMANKTWEKSPASAFHLLEGLTLPL